MIIIIPLIITILGLMYIFSPIDFIPELIFGPIGLVDDVVVGIVIISSWVLYFSIPLIAILAKFILSVAVVFGLAYFAVYLMRKTK